MDSSEAAAPAVARRCLREVHIVRGRAKRGRSSPLAPAAVNGAAAVGKVEGIRPTVAEQAAAVRVIAAIAAADKEGLEPPLMDQRAAAPKPHIVALALAIYYEQEFASEAKAKLAFGVGKGTDVGKGTAWQCTLARLFAHSPDTEAAAAICFRPKPKAAGAARTPRLVAPTQAVAHRTPPTAAPMALADADLEWQWWRRGFAAARAEQDEYVREATAAAIAAAQERAAAAERGRADAERGRADAEASLEYVVDNYMAKSDKRRRLAASRAAFEQARAERAEAACNAYEDAFDDFGYEQHSDPEIDEVLCDEREKLLDARACAMARARQPLPQQNEEEDPPWTYLFCSNWLDVLREEVARAGERAVAECERESERALSILRAAPGSAPGGA